MPATWGYGAAGSEPITMAGWGYLSDLAGTAVTAVGIYVISDLDDKHEISDRGDRHKFYDPGDRYGFIDPDDR